MKGPTLYGRTITHETSRPTVVRSRNEAGDLFGPWMAVCDQGHTWELETFRTHAEALAAALDHAATHQEDQS